MPVIASSGSSPLATKIGKLVDRSSHENSIPIDPTNLYTRNLHFSIGMSNSLLIFCLIYQDLTIFRRDIAKFGHISANFGEFRLDSSSPIPLTSRR